MRNAMVPVVTFLAFTLVDIIAGSIIIEQVFNIPGMGQFFTKAIKECDYTLIGGTTVFYGAFLVVAILVVDILYGFIDPRIKLVKVKE